MRAGEAIVSYHLSVVSCQLSVLPRGPEESEWWAVQDFRELMVWRKAHELTLAVYEATQGFPSFELFGLTRQMRRAAGSIGANIAEGAGRDSGLDFGRFLQMAVGSASELEYHTILARDLHYLQEDLAETIIADAQEVRRMLSSLIQKVRRVQKPPRRPS